MFPIKNIQIIRVTLYKAFSNATLDNHCSTRDLHTQTHSLLHRSMSHDNLPSDKIVTYQSSVSLFIREREKAWNRTVIHMQVTISVRFIFCLYH